MVTNNQKIFKRTSNPWVRGSNPFRRATEFKSLQQIAVGFFYFGQILSQFYPSFYSDTVTQDNGYSHVSLF